MSKIAVIGGGAAGMMFSTQYKKLNPNDEVTVFEKTKYVAWAGCPTPYYISNELSFNDVVLGAPEDFKARGVNVLINHEVKDINFDNKELEIAGSEISGTFKYDKLILAFGAKSFVPSIKGYKENLENVFTLSHAVHAEKIKEYLDTKKDLKKAVVVGAGFIGLEMAEAFKKRGLDVTIIEKIDIIFPSMSQEMKEPILKEIEVRDVKLKMNSGVVEVKSSADLGQSLVLDSGEEVNFDVALFSIGITPNIGFIKNDKLETKSGKIVVNDKFETNIKDVYALGDTIFTKNILTNDDLYVPFGDVANKEAIILAKYLSGENVSWKGALKSFATSFYDIKIAQTGLSLEEAKKHGFNAEKLEMKAMAKNSGFEDSKPNKVEIIYDKDKKVLLGGTIIGYDAVAQFIDQIAIVITFDIPIEKFIDIDFAYSPTNASVWNPLLVAYRKIIK
ncbi:MAG: FAD-dependent oxidoreductase [Sebaldella sp.]|nr:FAD-dependent oxidoreductase [Sebaldella sp.]